MPECAYCHNERELQRSHSIPDAFFRSISRQNNGQLLAIPTGDGRIHLSQETGLSELLCARCEGDFNKWFDGPLVNAFKRWDKKFIESGAGAKLDFSAEQMAQGLASIFWRASVSGNDLYSGAKVSPKDTQRLLEIVRVEPQRVFKMCSCSIWRLYDKRQHTSPSDISQIILPVTAHSISFEKQKKGGYFSLTAVFQGFLSQLFIPKLPYLARNSPQFLRPNSSTLIAPMKHFVDYEPLLNAILRGMDKEIAGETALRK